MKQFSLEEYLKNPSRKVITRDGDNVRIICTDKIGDCPLVVLIKSELGNEAIFEYTKDGKWYYDERECSLDLFFAPEKHEGWLNIYRSDECGFYIRGKSPYESKEKADKVAKANPKTFFTTIKVEWEE